MSTTLTTPENQQKTFLENKIEDEAISDEAIEYTAYHWYSCSAGLAFEEFSGKEADEQDDYLQNDETLLEMCSHFNDIIRQERWVEGLECNEEIREKMKLFVSGKLVVTGQVMPRIQYGWH